MSALVARLNAEQTATPSRTLQAALLHERAVLEEAAGEEPIAARDYLAAFNAEPAFREPLEALVRILTRRKSVKNLGKLLDALTRAALTPEERSRAHWERAAYLADYEHNLAGAKEALLAAVADNPEDPTAWLELELAAARDKDVEGRMRAIEARAELATDPTWKALLLVDLALLSWKTGDASRGYELLDAAAALGGRAGFRTRQALEEIATGERDVAVLAHALEGQADMIAEAIEDEAAGDASGVPRAMRTAEHAAEAWFRAAELKRRLGDVAGWGALLARAADRLPGSGVIARARIVALETAGDGEGAAAIARAELDRGAKGTGAAALWMRVAEAAALRADRPGALEALEAALAADPACIPARALQLDLLADNQDPAALARSLEASAGACATPEAKGRAALLAAFVWACRAGDLTRARETLATSGVSPELVARVSRMLAAIGQPAVEGVTHTADPRFFEDATQRLVDLGVEPSERASLWFELARTRLLRGDEAGAAAAFERIAEAGAEDGVSASTAWLGRVLGAYAIGLAQGDAAEGAPTLLPAAPLLALARVEADAAMARGLSIVAALRAARRGELEAAREILRDLAAALPGDEVAAVFLAEIDRRAGDPIAAAAALAGAALAVEEDDVAAALHLEAALLLWRAGDKARALDALEAARAGAARSAATVLAWALRGADADDVAGRRRALDAAAEAGADRAVLALERLGLEAATLGPDGSPEALLEALADAEREGAEDLAVAAALARLVVPTAADERDALERALSELVEAGGDGPIVAAAERFRLARAVDRDALATLERAAGWAASDRSLAPAVEWLAATLAVGDRTAEASARQALAERFAAVPDADPSDGEASLGARAALEASVALVLGVNDPAGAELCAGDAPVLRLANLELALPGSDPSRRAAALEGLGDALGEDAGIDALALAGWAHLAAGEAAAAQKAFRAVVAKRPHDLASWEGARSAAEQLGDHVAMALAAAQLGALSVDDARGAELWEQAGLTLLEKTDAHEDAEIAFDRAFRRDPSRAVAFDKLFRRLRARNEDDALLDVIARRLEVADDEAEIGKMYWERARVLRKKGDRDGALEALENVTLLEPDHVGALALQGEIQISRGDFAHAAPTLARLATIKEAPKQQRLISGVAAVDIFETRLGALDKALEVLLGLHRAGLSTLAVRERIARVAAKGGAWEEATAILEQLMVERETREGRVEAARLALVIWRDKLHKPLRADAAAAKLLDEAPDDSEALDLVLTTGFDPAFRSRALGRGKATLLQALAERPADAARVTMLAKIAGAGQDAALRQATLGALVALGNGDPALSDELARLDGRVSGRPEVVLDARALADIADPGDTGPVPLLFAALAETIGLALGPTLASLGVGRKERIDARGGHPVRMAVAEWMGALGFEGDFDVYVGGPNPRAVHGIAGEQPAIVLGSAVTAPFDAASRSALAREVFALRRGVTSVRLRDDNTVASVVFAACAEAGLPVQPPPYAVYNEVARAIRKEISRKVKKAILEPCQRFLQSGQDARAWAASARRSLDRMAVIAAGDVSVVLSDVLGAPRNELGALVAENERALRLLSFVLSPSYLELRRQLGMGVR